MRRIMRKGFIFGMIILVAVIFIGMSMNVSATCPYKGTVETESNVEGIKSNVKIIGKEGTFNINSGEIEYENGKPVIRLFSTTWCPHCTWIRDTFDRVVEDYIQKSQIVAYHWDLDTGDNTLTDDVETEVPQSELVIFKTFNSRGSVPTFVFGNKYWRIGNEYEGQNDLNAEASEFRTIIEKLIQNIEPVETSLEGDVTADAELTTPSNDSSYDAKINSDTQNNIEPTKSKENIKVIVFYSSTCGKCHEALVFLNEMKQRYPNLNIEKYSTAERENEVLKQSYFEHYNVPKVERGVLGVFIGDEYFTTTEDLEAGFENAINEYQQDSPTPEVEPNENIITETFNSFSVFAVASAGLIDGINPCAFAIMVFFIGYLVTSGRKRKQILLTGIAFATGVFVTYVLLGVGLFRVLQSIEGISLISMWMYPIAGLIALVLGIFCVSDYFKAKKGEKEKMVLQLPRRVKKSTSRFIKSQVKLKNITVLAFFTGSVISMFEFMCTGQIYLPTIVYITSVSGYQLQAFSYLILYNLMFILPLIGITLVTYRGMGAKRLTLVLDRRRPIIKLLTATVLFVMAFYLIGINTVNQHTIYAYGIGVLVFGCIVTFGISINKTIPIVEEGESRKKHQGRKKVLSLVLSVMLMATVFAIIVPTNASAEEPEEEILFDYLLTANGTKLPVTFNWTVTATATETWYSYDYKYSGFTCYDCFGHRSCAGVSHPGYEFIDKIHLPNDGRCGCPTGLYDSPRLVSSSDHTSYFYCVYRKTEKHTTTRILTDSGTATIYANGTVAGNLDFTINFATHPNYQDGTFSSVSSTISVDNLNVTASKTESFSGKVLSGDINATSTATGPWSAKETGSGNVDVWDLAKLIHTSNLTAPSNDTIYSVTWILVKNVSFYDKDDDGVIEGGGIIVWMSGNKLYASRPNKPPTAIIDTLSPSIANKNEVISFEGHGIDTDGFITSYLWRSHRDAQLSTSSSFNTSSLSQGTHVIYFSVQDNNGAWSPVITAKIRINQVPIAFIQQSTQRIAIVGSPAWLSGKGIDLDGYIIDYSWESSIDGYLGNSNSFYATNLSLGHHTIYFKVKDNDGTWSDAVSRNLIIRRTPIIYIHGYPFLEFPGPYKIVWHKDVIEPLQGDGLQPDVEFFPKKGSLAAYAGVLDKIVLELRRNTGAEKVDLVGYSEGSLVARWYTQFSYRNDVRKFMGLAPVNHGSDWGYIGGLVEFFAGKAAVEMTPHSWFFNALNHNDKCATYGEGIDYTRPGVHYHTIAGTGYITPAHKHFCFTIDLFFWEKEICFLFPWATTKGDGVVPIRSAFISDVEMDKVNRDHGSMQYPILKTNDGVTIAQGTNQVVKAVGSAISGNVIGFFWHGIKAYNYFVAVNMDKDIWTRMKFILEDDPLPPTDPGFESDNASYTAFQYSEPINGVIEGDQPTPETLEIDSTVSTAYFMLYHDGNLNFDLYTPENQLIDKENPEYNYTVSEGMVSYTVDNPEAGMWRFELQPGEINDAYYGTNYTAMAFMETEVFVGIATDEIYYSPGDDMYVLAYVQSEGSGLPGAFVSAEITLPDMSTKTIQLFDDGLHYDNDANDGVYGNSFGTVEDEGGYMLKTTAFIEKDGETLKRTAATTAWIISLADLTLSSSDISFSNDNPSAGETITINAQVHNFGEGSASSAQIIFYDGDPEQSINEIGRAVVSVENKSSSIASVNWTAVSGSHDVHVIISPFAEFYESDYTNNQASKTIIVSDLKAPIADAGPDQTVVVSSIVKFDGSSSTDDVGITRYSWDINTAIDSDGDGITDNDVDLTGEEPVLVNGYRIPGIYTVQLAVDDAEGNGPIIDTLTINATNDMDVVAPVADAGEEQTVEVNRDISFHGSASYDNYDVAMHLWDVDTSVDSDTDGIADNDVDLIGGRPTLLGGYSTLGTYSVKLTVDDSAGNGPVSDTIIVTVVDTTSPEVSFEPPTPEEGSEIGKFIVVVRASDYFLEKVEILFDGVVQEVCDADGLTELFCMWKPEIHTISEGSHTIKTVARDSSGNVELKTVTFEVHNIPSVADANGPYAGDEGSPITFDASGSSDPDSDTLQYRWDFDNDGIWDTEYSTDPTAAHIWNDDYFGGVIVEVSDGEYSDLDTAMVIVNNVPPSISGTSDQTGNEGSSITFIAGTVSDPGTDIFEYRWDWNSDGTYDTSWSSSNSSSNTWTDDYSGMVTVQVKDDDRGMNTDICTVTVNNVAPTASIDSFVQPFSKFILPTDELEFHGSFTDPGTEDTHTIEWDFEDGTTVTETLTPTYAYTESGVYTVTLTVTDDDGGEDSTSIEIVVKSPSEATEELIDDIEEMNLHDGIENSLISKLSNAIKSIDKDQNKTAINQLNAFINEVEAQRRKKITSEQADILIATVKKIVHYLE